MSFGKGLNSFDMKIKNQTVSIPLISNQHLNIHLYTLLNKVCNTDNEMAGKEDKPCSHCATFSSPAPALVERRRQFGHTCVLGAARIV